MSDYEVVKLVLEGNKDDFEEIIRRYKNLVFALIHRMTAEPEEANDIAQDIFIKIYRNLDKYNPEYRFATWVIKITTNHIIDLRRKKRQETVPIENVEYGIFDSKASPEEEYIANERSKELFGMINNLPDIYREPLLFYHRDGLSYNEISQKTGESLSKIKNRIFRGRKMLKEGLMKEGAADGLF